MSSDDLARRLVAFPLRDDEAADRRRRGKGKRDVLRSPSYLALRSRELTNEEGDRRSRSPARRRARPDRYFDADVVERRSRSRSPRRRRAHSKSYSGEVEDEPDRRSPSPRRRRRERSNSYSDDEDEPDHHRSPSPRRRRRALSNSYSDDEDEPERRHSPSPRRPRRARSNSFREDEEEEEPDRRSRIPRRRLAPRSCRNGSRTRSQECEDRRCCRRVPLADEVDMSEDEDDFYVRIDRSDHLFKCARCHNLLPLPVVYECVEGHVTCATCHGSANGGEGAHSCSQCGSSNYGASAAVSNWLRSVRFSCRNYDYGCPSFLPRRELEADHERSCPYAPVFCPVRRCDFHGGPKDLLERHLSARHGWSVDAFRYGEPFRVRVHPAPLSLLRAEDGELFHLRAKPERGGTALSMIRIRPDNAAAAEFTYEVKTPAAVGLQHRLQMQSTVWATSLRNGPADANPVSVTVPDDMFPLEGPEQDSVEVRVQKVAPAAAARDD